MKMYKQKYLTLMVASKLIKISCSSPLFESFELQFNHEGARIQNGHQQSFSDC